MLLTLKDKVLEEIKLAVESKDSRRIMTETARLSEIEALIERQEALNRQVEALSSAETRTLSSPAVQEQDARVANRAESPREVGVAKRIEFVRACAAKGVRLTPKKGALYENSLREVVGIAFATERRDDAWFLGLPSQGLTHTVLICQPQVGEAFSVCLPNRFLQKYRSLLSESKGQMKFNVRRRGGHHFLIVPSLDPVQIDEYIDRPEQIK